MTHYLVVEDEAYFDQIITRAVNSVDPGSIIYHAESVKEAQDYTRHMPIDLFVIDVQLPDGNGVVFAESLRKMPQYQCSPIILETVVDNPAFQIDSHKRVTYTSYITKPYNIAEMGEKISLANRFLANTHVKRLELKLAKKYVCYFDINAIIYIHKQKASKNIKLVIRENGELKEQELHRVSLHEVLEALENKNELIQCHKSYLINPQYIETICANEIKLKYLKKPVPLGGVYSGTVLQGKAFWDER